MTKIENFILDEDKKNEMFNSDNKNILIHKDKFDDRFVIIYMKEHSNNLYQTRYASRDYSLCAYVDIKDKVIYNCESQLVRFFSEDSIFKFSNFDSIEKKLEKEIDAYIEKYSFDNAEELKKEVSEIHDNKEDYRFNNYKKEVRELFLAEDNPIIKFEKYYNETKVIGSEEFYHKNYLSEYLDDKEKIISKFANTIIEDNKKNIGLSLYLYQDKMEYLNLIKLNIGNEFKELYQKKKIYNSIKDLNAQKINITITYNNKDFTFKYDYLTLRRDLLNDYETTSSYGSVYDIVRNFLKENTINENGRYDSGFKFSHIKSITYGRNEVYRNDSIDKNKKVEKER